jgi:hypothetical protein
VVSSLLKSMQDLPITAIVQKEGGTQLKLIIDFQVELPDGSSIFPFFLFMYRFG